MYNLSSIKIIEFCSIIAIIYKEFNFRLNFRYLEQKFAVCGHDYHRVFQKIITLLPLKIRD